MSLSLKSIPRITGLSFTLLAVAAFAQSTGQPTAPPPVSYTSVNELNNIVGQLQQMSKNVQTDLSSMRVDRWKTDSSTKRQTQANVESIQRNLQTALPEITAELNKSPEDLGNTFKLYRNLDALYDVFGSVVESAGAFGTKDDFQNLSNDLNALEGVRRSLGERLQNLAASKENELNRLRGIIHAMQTEPPAPPKRVIVDDTEPPKKPAKKKAAKPSTPPPANPNSQSAPPSK